MAKAMGKRTANTTITKEANELYICPHCGKTKKKSEFYVSSDPAVSIGIAFPCKDCAEKIARNYNTRYKTYGDCTVENALIALEYLDKPFIPKIWDSSYKEVHEPKTDAPPKTSVWGAYIKSINSLQQYKTLRWKDGDIFKKSKENENTTGQSKTQEVIDECEQNKKDIIRLIGYDPFDKESEDDKPLLYAQLRGYIDSDGNNDDMTRVLDSIEIVRGYLQLQKLNDMSAKAFANLAKTGQSGEIKSYMETKKKVADVISQLAEQSCISLKHNKNAKKGENTWTGKIKKLKELNLREAEVNGFDIGTCRGMQQVLEMSDASIMKQLHLDESEWSDMVAEQRKKIVLLQKKVDLYQEINRIILRENLDLRDTLQENNTLDEGGLQNLKQLFSPFANLKNDDIEEASEEEVIEEETPQVDENTTEVKTDA